MKPTTLASLLLVAVISPLAAQNAAPQPSTTTARRRPARVHRVRKAPSEASADQIRALQEALAAQDRRIRQLEQEIRQRDQAWQQAQSQAKQEHPFSLGEVASTTPMVPSAVPSPAPAPQAQSGERKPSAIELANGKIKIGAVVYGDWGIYPQAGRGPAFFTQITPLGPGNDNYNAFDLTRSYLNVFFTPNRHVTFRITPNLYRDSTTSGNPAVRIKYAYGELDHLFESSPAFKDQNIRLGQQTNPLIDWEEGLYGYRFVNLVPWNFISLSSTHIGVSLNGPFKSNGKQYVDWQIGAFNDANFHQIEQSARKQGMARISFYPLGASSKYQGLGLTGFIDYGFSNTPVASEDSKGFPLYRVAAIGHYTTMHNGASLAFEYDLGRNAFSSGNLFSGSGRPSGGDAPINPLAVALLDNNRFRATKQQGFDVFGHMNIPNSKFTLFGMYQFFQPNTEVARNPFDFHRIVGGIAYKYSRGLRFALDSQNIIWRQSQFVFPASEASLFGAYTGGDVANPVPKDTMAVFVNMELSF